MGFPNGYETDNWPFIQARWFTPVVNQRREVRLIVIHTMEIAELGDSAERAAAYFKNSPDGRKVSAHLCIDNNSIIQCVHDNDIAWAAPGANHNGIQLELAGRAAQSHDEWFDDYSKNLLENAAKATAQYCLKYALPAKHLSNKELNEGQEGIIGHSQASNVFKKSDHWDPGQHFPWDHFIERVEHYQLMFKSGIDKNEVTTEKRYIVQAKDTLSKIARRYNLSLSQIIAANPQITDPNHIQVNDIILIPESHGSSTLDMDEVDVMARTIYGEARGEPDLGKIAVGWVIQNRLALNTWYGNTVSAVCLKPYQFSCWNLGNPNLPKLRAATEADSHFAKCRDASIKVLSSDVQDPTNGATHYHAAYIKPPPWTIGAKFTVRIGNHLFYKNVD